MIRCMAYTVGKQYFEQIGGQLYEIPEDNPNEVRYRVNFIQPAVERATSKVANVQGKLRVAPRNGSPRSRKGAKVSDQVLSHILDVTDYQTQKMTATKWAAICGTGFLKVSWDPNKGDPTRFYTDKGGKTLIPESDEERLELEKHGLFEDVFAGEIRVDPVSPFALHWDWDSRAGIEECSWVAEVSYMSRSKVAQLFDVDVKTIDRDDEVTGPAMFDEAVAFMTSGAGETGFAYQPKQKEKDGRVLLTQFWMRPSKTHPKGRFIVRAGRSIIVNRDNPYRALGRGEFALPFVKVDWSELPGRFMSMGLVEHLMVPQFRYNEARSKMTEFQNVFGQPPIFVPNNSGIDPDNFVLQPGMIYPYNANGGTPTPMPAPALPQEVAQNSMVAQNEINFISSQTDPDLSGAPGQMRSAQAIGMYFKEKNQSLSTIQTNSLKVDRQVARMMLALAKINYSNDRAIHYVGTDGEFGVLPFSSVDVHHDVRIVGGAQDADSIHAFKAEMAELIELGALNPAENRDHWQLVTNAYRYNTMDEASQDWARDQANQEREIEEMVADPLKWIQGPYPVAEYEDHEIHMKTLARYMKTDEFRVLDIATQGVLYSHFQLHQQAIQKMMQAQAEAMEAAKGTPGQKGEASQPRRG